MSLLRKAAGLVLLVPAACHSPSGGHPLSGPRDDALYVGAAKVEITPPVEAFEDRNGNTRYDKGEPFTDLNGNGKWDPTFLAGFGINRTALGVHDPLWVRGAVFEKRGRRALVLSCDLVGLLHLRVRQLRSRIKDVDDVIIASTHVHSGPDVVGLWGPLPGFSGVSGDFMRRLGDAAVECARKALAARTPARLVAGSALVEGVCKDIRPPDVRNERVSSVIAYDEKGRPVTVLVNFAMHPEGMGSRNREVSSDYPHYVREALEREYPGATAVFLSGDLGGMQTPDVKEKTWDEIRRCGEAIAAKARESLAGGAEVAVPEVKFARAPVEFAVDNRKFVAAFTSGILGEDTEGLVRADGERLFVTSEVAALRLGDVLLVTVPGEALPEVGREVFALMGARHKLLLGLGQDEVGYILPKEAFDPKKYEESMSLGPETAPTLLDALKKLLKGF